MLRHIITISLVATLAALVASCGGGSGPAPQKTVAVEVTVIGAAAEQVQLASATGNKVGGVTVVTAIMEAKIPIGLDTFWIAFKDPEGNENEAETPGPVAAGGTFTTELRLGSTVTPVKVEITEIRKIPTIID